MSDELKHHGIKGQRWGIRRFQKKGGGLTPAGKKRYSDGYIKDALGRKTDRFDDPAARKKKIDADMKEADDRVKFYGSKRAAKVAIREEANYAKKINNGKAFIDTLKFGAAPGAVAGVVAGALSSTVGVGMLVTAAPVAAVGLATAVIAKKANSFINKHAKDQILYTDDSEYGHDLVIAYKKHD